MTFAWRTQKFSDVRNPFYTGFYLNFSNHLNYFSYLYLGFFLLDRREGKANMNCLSLSLTNTTSRYKPVPDHHLINPLRCSVAS